jgi:hypothetical protein
MSLPLGWGSSYCSTWWGDWKNINRAIPFETRPDCIKYIPPVPAYIVRVEADGGTVEAKDCLANEIEYLKNN